MERKLKFCGCTPNYSNLKQEVKLELSYKSISDIPNSLEYTATLSRFSGNDNTTARPAIYLANKQPVTQKQRWMLPLMKLMM